MKRENWDAATCMTLYLKWWLELTTLRIQKMWKAVFQRAAKCGLHSSVKLTQCSPQLDLSLFCNILGEWTWPFSVKYALKNRALYAANPRKQWGASFCLSYNEWICLSFLSVGHLENDVIQRKIPCVHHGKELCLFHLKVTHEVKLRKMVHNMRHYIRKEHLPLKVHCHCQNLAGGTALAWG